MITIYIYRKIHFLVLTINNGNCLIYEKYTVENRSDLPENILHRRYVKAQMTAFAILADLGICTFHIYAHYSIIY